MLITPHFAAGMTIAKYVDNWPLAVLSAVIVHFVLDYIPHKDMVGSAHINKGNIMLRTVDFSAAMIFFYLFAPPDNRFYFFLIGTAAMLPDLIEMPGLIWPKWRELPLVRNFHPWHTHELQYSWPKVNWFWGLLPQVVLMGFCIYFLTK